MVLGSCQDYRLYLRSLLERRIKHNPRYSLRAFARDLGISPSRMSDVLKGHKGLSLQSGSQIALKLQLDAIETQYFCDLVSAQHARSQSERQAALARIQSTSTLNKYKILDDDEFHLIANWYHLALLELLAATHRHYDTDGLAAALNISPFMTTQAMERMQRLGLVELDSKGYWRRLVSGVSTSRDIPSEAIRHHHRQVIEKSLEALTVQDVQERDFSSITVAVSPQQILLIKQLIEGFKRDFINLVESSLGPRELVYALGVQLFNLSTNESSRDNVPSESKNVKKPHKGVKINALHS